MSLVVHRLTPDRGRLPFDCRVTGFDLNWWCDGATLRGREYLSVSRDGVEVARAEVDPQSTDVDEYVGLDLPGTVVKIEFFEVRKHLRGRGVGRLAVAAVTERYEGPWFTVVAVTSAGFWTSIGWTEARHATRPDTPTARYLFNATAMPSPDQDSDR
jgi:GNAT superfamily N-acetyltransferase